MGMGMGRGMGLELGMGMVRRAVQVKTWLIVLEEVTVGLGRKAKAKGSKNRCCSLWGRSLLDYDKQEIRTIISVEYPEAGTY